MEEISYSDLKEKFITIHYLLKELYSLCFSNKKLPRKSGEILEELFNEKYIDEYLHNVVSQTNSKYVNLYKGQYCKLSSDDKAKLETELNLTIDDIKYYIEEKEKEFKIETKKIFEEYINR